MLEETVQSVEEKQDFLTALKTVGNIVEFGHYEQDNDLNNGEEPIEWIVLDVQDGKSLLISKNCLESAAFHQTNSKVTWESCSLRKWLNDNFWCDAFSKSEQGLVQTTTVDNDKTQRDSDWNTIGEPDTRDKVFLLSYAETATLFDTDMDRVCQLSDYAAAHEKKWENNNNDRKCWWWLRSLGPERAYKQGYGYCVAYVSSYGKYDDTCFVDLSYGGVRPALWIDHEAVAEWETIGQIITFGRYEQDNNLENGPEPIEWIILDVQDGKRLLISKYGLDCQPYHQSHGKTTWAYSSLRNWLNSTFLKTAFITSEQNVILNATVDNNSSQGNSNWNTIGGNNTIDRIFLLSYAEANQYFDSDDDRISQATDYAKGQGAHINSSNDSCWWWLRSPGSNQDDAADVGAGGALGYNTAVNYDGDTVRPAIWIDHAKWKLALEKNRLSDELNRAAQEGTTVTFGNYEQDNDMENGAEPIEWILLKAKGNKYLLLSKYILDWKQFVESDKYYTWEVSTLRSWLNQDFIETAFDDLEKKLISKNYVDNSYGQGIPGVNVYGGGNTSDLSFVLSYAEAQQFFPTDEDRTCMQTEFAKTQGVSKEESSRWWLRSPGTVASKSKQNGICAVNSNGSIGTFFASTTMQGVRPAIWIDLDAIFK